MAVKKFEHVGIQVRDIEESKRFYQQVVGLALMDELLHNDGKMKLAFLGLNGDIIIELIEGYNPDLPKEGKVHHIALTVDEIESEKERIQKEGVKLVWDEVTNLPNGAKYLFFLGPDGEWIEYYEPLKN
ncbi:lactoylglutathione lyase [Bacillus pakistanensis]|uniref:Lactoylglutathione lyase n=1 Tax=Rossellomorea pakistanensis TaxID=992288 RepID=A0ABS2N869_9BACI|nr:VOC family protein [Bacillus pakistanensis]MBM7584052.1 lactoylglutathione lyase [Bacillus pakistanensis]